MRRAIGSMMALVLSAALAAGCKDPPSTAGPGATSGAGPATGTGAAPGPGPGSGKDSDERAIVIAYSAPKLVGGQSVVHQGLERYVKEKGWQLITATSDGDPQRQIDQIQNFLGAKVSAIVAVPEDSRRICAAVESAQTARVPFYAIDRAPEGCRINMTVLADNHLAGRQSGEAMVELLKQRHRAPRGVVLEVTGNMAQNVAQLRSKGFQDALRGYPEIRRITREANWETAKCEAAVREVLAATPDLDGIFLHSDAVYMECTLKVLRAERRLHRREEAGHVFLTAVDGHPAGVQAIREGHADQCSSQPTLDYSLVLDWVQMELNGQVITAQEVKRDGALWSPARVTPTEIGPQLVLATTSVTPRNVDDPRLWTNQLTPPRH